MESDGDYDFATDSASEYWADVVDEEELDLDLKLESESEFGQISDEEVDEEELVQSTLFAVEWSSAIDHIRKLAKYDQERIVCSVLDQMDQDTEEAAALEMVEEAMDSLRATVLEFDDTDSEDADRELAVEMEEALQNVRELGTVHGEQIAMRICDLYFEENGEEMSARKLTAIFSDVQDCFAEEAVSTDSELEGEVAGTADPDTFTVERASAMDHVRAIAKCHREQLVDRLSAIYEEENERDVTEGVLTEILDVVRESFADEAMDELLDEDLEIAESDDDDEDDSDYCPESDDDDQYAFDAVDDGIYRDSTDQDGSESDDDSEFDADQDAKDLKELYDEDVEDDLADSDATDSDSESVKEQEELKEAEVASHSDSDSEYSPDGDAFDYTKDYELEYEQSGSASESTESEQSTDDEADYNPDYDLFDYSLDFEVHRESEDDLSDTDTDTDSQSESEEQEEEDVESDDDGDYVVEKDTFDYSQDVEDDIECSSVDEQAEEDQVAA